MNEHDGLNGLDASKINELHDIRMNAAINRVQSFLATCPDTGTHTFYNDERAYYATELLREMWVAKEDFTGALHSYGWSIKEFVLPYTHETLGVQLVTPRGLIVLWKHDNAEQLVNDALRDLPNHVMGAAGLISQYAWLRALSQGWVTIKRAFQIKKEF